MPSTRLTFAAVRITIGAGSWIAPRLAVRSLGADPVSQQPFVTRLFGVRDLALGVAILDRSADVRRRGLQAGILCDGADLLAAVRGARDGSLPRRAAVLGGAGAALATALGVLALLEPAPARP